MNTNFTINSIGNSIGVILLGVAILIHMSNDDMHVKPVDEPIIARQVFRAETPSSRLDQLESARKYALFLKEKITKNIEVNKDMSKDDNTPEQMERLSKLRQDLFKQFDDVNDILKDFDEQIKLIKHSI